MRPNYDFDWKIHYEASAPWAAKCAPLVQKSASNLLQKSAPTYGQIVLPELENQPKIESQTGRARPFPPPARTLPLPGRHAPHRLGSPEIHVDFFVDFQSTPFWRPLCLWRGLSIFARKKCKKHIFCTKLAKRGFAIIFSPAAGHPVGTRLRSHHRR